MIIMCNTTIYENNAFFNYYADYLRISCKQIVYL